MSGIDKRLEISWRTPESLTPWSKNAKIHSTEQVDKIAGQIAAFGFDQPIVVDPSGVIIKGHGRREAALRLGMKEVPVIVQTLDEYEAMAARIADNKVSEAPWDLNMLRVDVGTLALRDFDMSLTGILPEDLTQVLKEETSDLFPEHRQQTPQERSEAWEHSDIRQIVMICEPEKFDSIMARFGKLIKEFNVETTIDVVEKLFDFYETNRPHTQS